MIILTAINLVPAEMQPSRQWKDTCFHGTLHHLERLRTSKGRIWNSTATTSFQLDCEPPRLTAIPGSSLNTQAKLFIQVKPYTHLVFPSNAHSKIPLEARSQTSLSLLQHVPMCLIRETLYAKILRITVQDTVCSGVPRSVRTAQIGADPVANIAKDVHEDVRVEVSETHAVRSASMPAQKILDSWKSCDLFSRNVEGPPSDKEREGRL